MPVGDRVERVAHHEQRRDHRRRPPWPRRGDRVEDEQDGERCTTVGIGDDRSDRGGGQRDERPAPADEDREDGDDRDRHQPRPVVVDRLGNRRADRRHRKRRGERDVLRALRRVAQPRGQGRGHARERIPGPVPRGSDLAGPRAPCAGGEGGADQAIATAIATPSASCTSTPVSARCDASATVGMRLAHVAQEADRQQQRRDGQEEREQRSPITGPRDPRGPERRPRRALSAAATRTPAVPATIAPAAGAGAASRPARREAPRRRAAAVTAASGSDDRPGAGDARAEERHARAAGRGQVAEDAGLDVLGAGGRADDRARRRWPSARRRRSRPCSCPGRRPARSLAGIAGVLDGAHGEGRARSRRA